MEVRRIAGALGAEVLGVDLSGTFSEKEIRKAFLEHQVIFFRDQKLDPAQFMAFARSMGKPVEYPFVTGLDGFPEVIEVKKLEHEKHNFGGIWHSDTAYLQEPPMGSMLLAREIPPYGGDTEFASQYLAYEALSEGMKRLLDGLFAINSSSKADVTRTREDMVKEYPKQYEAEHPVVRTHPETGRKALYLSRSHTICFKDMSEEESRPLIDFLQAHQIRPEFTCRVRWSPGTLTVWDNRCTQHCAVNDYHGQRRRMRRLTVGAQIPR
jgi:taurine dioxygenase